MRSKNFNDALKKAINGNWSFAHIRLTYEEKRGPELGYSVKLFQTTGRPLQDHRSLSNRQARLLRSHKS